MQTPGGGGGAYIWRGDLTEGFLHYEFGGLYLEGLIHGGAYFWNFTVILILYIWVKENYVDFKWVIIFCFPVSTELCKNQWISCTRR